MTSASKILITNPAVRAVAAAAAGPDLVTCCAFLSLLQESLPGWRTEYFDWPGIGRLLTCIMMRCMLVPAQVHFRRAEDTAATSAAQASVPWTWERPTTTAVRSEILSDASRHDAAAEVRLGLDNDAQRCMGIDLRSVTTQHASHPCDRPHHWHQLGRAHDSQSSDPAHCQ